MEGFQPEPVAPPVAPVPFCAVHEGAHSTGTCGRCGNYVCPFCLDDTSPLYDHCEACREREGGGKIAWERDEGGLLGRWWQTCRDIVGSPRLTIESVRPGSPLAALGHTTLTGVLIGTFLAALGSCALGGLAMIGGLDQVTQDASLSGIDEGIFLGIMLGVIVLYPLLTGVGMVISASLRTLVYHFAVWIFGGQGGIGTSFWSICYLQSIQLVSLPLTIIGQIPIIGPMINLAGILGIEVWTAIQLTTVAQRYHGMDGGRATAAGWSWLLFLLGMVIFCCLGMMVLIASMPNEF